MSDDNVRPIGSAKTRRHVGSLVHEYPQTLAMIRLMDDAFTRIGNALGLEGRFRSHFGYEQIEVRAKDAMIRMASLERDDD